MRKILFYYITYFSYQTSADLPTNIISVIYFPITQYISKLSRGEKTFSTRRINIISKYHPELRNLSARDFWLEFRIWDVRTIFFFLAFGIFSFFWLLWQQATLNSYFAHGISFFTFALGQNWVVCLLLILQHTLLIVPKYPLLSAYIPRIKTILPASLVARQLKVTWLMRCKKTLVWANCWRCPER